MPKGDSLLNRNQFRRMWRHDLDNAQRRYVFWVMTRYAWPRVNRSCWEPGPQPATPRAPVPAPPAPPPPSQSARIRAWLRTPTAASRQVPRWADLVLALMLVSTYATMALFPHHLASVLSHCAACFLAWGLVLRRPLAIVAGLAILGGVVAVALPVHGPGAVRLGLAAFATYGLHRYSRPYVRSLRRERLRHEQARR